MSRHHSKERKEDEKEQQSNASAMRIMEIPEVFAKECDEMVVWCYACGWSFIENIYVVSRKAELGHDQLCIRCDPLARSEWWGG